MFKNSLVGAACLLIASPAFAASGPSITAEVKMADPRGGTRQDSNEYRIEFSDSVLNSLNYGVEIAAKQNTNAGTLGTEVSAKAGPVLGTVFGISPTVYGEVGSSLKTGQNYEFWGTGVKASYPVYGPVSLVVGFRHRESFTHHFKNEERLQGGISLAASDKYSLGAQYYRTRGTTNSDAIGVSVARKF